MAKRTQTERFRTEKLGAVWERCPQRESYVKNALAKGCPSCHQFTFRSRMICKPLVNWQAALEQHVLLMTLKMGGLPAVTRATVDPLMAFWMLCGRFENMIRLFPAIEGKPKDVNFG